MRILAGSTESIESGFLHAGYISADVRSFGGHMLGGRLLVEKKDTESAHFILVMDMDRCEYIDTVTALQLEGGELTATPHVGALQPGALNNGSGGFNLLVALIFFACVGFYYAVRLRYKASESGRSRMRYAGVMILLFAAGIAVYISNWSSMGLARWSLVSAGTKPPWEGITLQRYKDPVLATKAIMQGVIADVLSSIPYPVVALTQIQNKVSFPSANLTKGQVYALKTYGLDGWGHPIHLKATPVKGRGVYRDTVCSYVLTSAGADGAFDTSDDISVKCTAPGEWGWDKAKRVFFARKAGDEWNFLCRRWEGQLFKFNNLDNARKLTNSEVYDMMRFEKPSELIPVEDRSALDNEGGFFCAKCEQAITGKNYDPLLLIILPE